LLGLVGAGRIGWSIAVKLRALGVKRVYYWARSRKPYLEVSLGAIYLPFEEIFELSDIVVVSLSNPRDEAPDNLRAPEDPSPWCGVRKRW